MIEIYLKRNVYNTLLPCNSSHYSTLYSVAFLVKVIRVPPLGVCAIGLTDLVDW